MSQELKVLFAQATLKAFPELTQEEALVCSGVEDPKNKEHGDYACSASFKLSKRFNENPRTIADKIIEHFPKDYRVESLEFAAPGFINLRLSDEFWLQLAIADNKIIAEPVMTGRDDADSGSFASRLLKIKGDCFDIGDWKKVRKEAGKRLAGN